MIKPISNRNSLDFQLVKITIDLVYKVLSITECNPELLNYKHILRATEAAREWNELFIESIINTKEGELS